MSNKNYKGRLLAIKSLDLDDVHQLNNLVSIPYQEDEIEEISISIIKLKPGSTILHCGYWMSPEPPADKFALLLVEQKVIKSWIRLGAEPHWFNI